MIYLDNTLNKKSRDIPMNNNPTPLSVCILSAIKAIDVNELAISSIDNAVDIIARITNVHFTKSHIEEIESVSVPFFNENHAFSGLQSLLAYFAEAHGLTTHYKAIAAIENLPLNEEYEFQSITEIGKRIYKDISSDIENSIERYFNITLNFYTGDICIPHLVCVSTTDDIENLDIRAAATIKSGTACNDNDVAGFESGAGQIYVPVAANEITYNEFIVATKKLNIEHYSINDLVSNNDYQISVYLGL